jgi:mannose-1-phosphate guanylyltransferase
MPSKDMGYAAGDSDTNVRLMLPLIHRTSRERTWVVVLTGGGADWNRRTLLERTLSRARWMVPCEQIVAVTDREQEHRWNGSFAMLPGATVIVQPYHRGSAIELLLAVLTILERDPWARIVAMPSHCQVKNEAALAGALLDAGIPTAQTRNNLAVIGIKPDRPDSESGFIVPGRWFEDGTRSVLRIVKPSGKTSARELTARGALWDSSIVAARALILLGVLRICAPAQVDQMETALAQGDRAEFRRRALTQLYEHLPSLDLSQVLAESAEAACRVITSRSCGWSNPATAQHRSSRCTPRSTHAPLSPHLAPGHPRPW